MMLSRLDLDALQQQLAESQRQLGELQSGERETAQISRLRQKLGEDARVPQIIKTVRNGGYVLAGQVTVEPAA